MVVGAKPQPLHMLFSSPGKGLLHHPAMRMLKMPTLKVMNGIGGGLGEAHTPTYACFLSCESFLQQPASAFVQPNRVPLATPLISELALSHEKAPRRDEQLGPPHLGFDGEGASRLPSRWLLRGGDVGGRRQTSSAMKSWARETSPPNEERACSRKAFPISGPPG